MASIVSMLESLERDIKTCARCGMCQSVCPLYKETRLETDVARGKLAILEGLRRSIFENSKGTAKRLYRCLLCGACEAQCPSGVKTIEIFLKARSIISECEDPSPLKRLLLRKILTTPSRFHKTMDLLASCQNLILRRSHPDFNLQHPYKTPLSQVPFHKKVPHFYRSTSKGPTVSIFVGCLIDKFFPSIAESVLKILEKLGFGIYLPDGQACCGIPALSLGDRKSFLSLVRRNVEIFTTTKYDFLVTACATCTAVIRKIWPSMISGESKDLIERTKGMSTKIIDVTEFLVRYGRLAEVRKTSSHNGKKVTYHDPCHLRKSLGLWREPRKLLSSLRDYQFVEMVDADSCCGFGGSFGVTYKNLSEQLGLRKVHNAIGSGADVITTTCPACIIQLSNILDRVKSDRVVKHVVELIV
ncbi:MAG: (Fe-S)-binding protein [Syntrophobacterales bacterium]|nr:(Fe-S)-binding protein [Syntrophobacterales bacterium]